MSLQTRRIIFLAVYLLIVLSGPYTVFVNTPFSSVKDDPVSLINFIQRISGLTLFSLLFIQILLGSLMNTWTQIIGAKALWVHVTQGVFIYFLALFHPLMEVSIVYQISGSILTALAVFIPRLSTQRETYLTFAKIALVMLTLSVSAGYFRTNPFFRRHWLKLHILNYFIFYLVYLHMRVGSDIMTAPFVYVSWIALVLVTYLALKRFVLPYLNLIKAKYSDASRSGKG